jgi:hypothetical protein
VEIGDNSCPTRPMIWVCDTNCRMFANSRGKQLSV